jgi:predicted esterase
MPYLADYNLLKNIYGYKNDSISVPGTDMVIRNFDFQSPENGFYPDDEYFRNIAVTDSVLIKKGLNKYLPEKYFDFISSNPDKYGENTDFRFPVYLKPGANPPDKVILLFHGLNESSWDKYHPWALKLLKDTGWPVILFPVSFHINRRPAEWSAPRKMNAISKDRVSMFPGIDDSSFVNAAISTRLHFIPELFFWSGYRSFNDVLKLAGMIRNGFFDFIRKDAGINFFGYSIGAFLTEHLLMIEKELFGDSRAVLFCGGPTMDLMYPASRYIYDTETGKSMTGFYVNDFEESVKGDPYLEKFFSRDVPEANVFRSMLNINNLPDYRDKNFTELKDRIYAVALTKDYVIPPDSVRKTLCGVTAPTGIKVDELDADIDYDHISPFPQGEKIKNETDVFFNRVFEKAAGFYLKQ